MSRKSQNKIAVLILLCIAALAGAALAGVGAAARGTTGAAQASEAATLYDEHCDTCHGKDGRAKTFKGRFRKARDLTDAQWQAEVTDERLFNSITHGRGKMPSFKKKLSTEQVESLVAYVRGLKR